MLFSLFFSCFSIWSELKLAFMLRFARSENSPGFELLQKLFDANLPDQETGRMNLFSNRFLQVYEFLCLCFVFLTLKTLICVKKIQISIFIFPFLHTIEHNCKRQAQSSFIFFFFVVFSFRFLSIIVRFFTSGNI